MKAQSQQNKAKVGVFQAFVFKEGIALWKSAIMEKNQQLRLFLRNQHAGVPLGWSLHYCGE